MQRLVTHCAILIITLGVVSPNAFAQRIEIVARDSANAVILDDVLVSLFDTAAAIVTAARTDRTGRVIMHAPTAGHYALKAQRIGWRPVISDWIRVAPGDSFEVTMKLPRLVVTLNEVTIRAQRDSLSHLLPLGINLKTLQGVFVSPAQMERHSPSARDYVDAIGSMGIAGTIVNTWRDAWGRERRCIGSAHSPSRRDCLAVFVDNIRADPETAIDLATPELLEFAVLLRTGDAGVLYGTGTDNGVLLVYTKPYRKMRSMVTK